MVRKFNYFISDFYSYFFKAETDDGVNEYLYKVLVVGDIGTGKTYVSTYHFVFTIVNVLFLQFYYKEICT